MQIKFLKNNNFRIVMINLTFIAIAGFLIVLEYNSLVQKVLKMKHEIIEKK